MIYLPAHQRERKAVSSQRPRHSKRLESEVREAGPGKNRSQGTVPCGPGRTLAPGGPVLAEPASDSEPEPRIRRLQAAR